MFKRIRLLVVVSLGLFGGVTYAARTPVIDHEFIENKKVEFESLDTKNAGYLDYATAAQLLPAVADQVDKIDANGDGKVTWSEVEFTLRSFNNVLDSRAAQEIRSLDPVQQ
ncbi:hypothetical protein [Aestuariirhabdus sp. LZHN29]|uniref:hypothetical protein n=1 Tax=Aestuariirhabdus sp. LZHN29 TaxID=3417462 RepID=UPI003CF7C235